MDETPDAPAPVKRRPGRPRTAGLQVVTSVRFNAAGYRAIEVAARAAGTSIQEEIRRRCRAGTDTRSTS